MSGVVCLAQKHMEPSMELNEAELDRIVFEVVSDAKRMEFTREEVARMVLEYIAPRMVQYILPSLDRLAEKGMIIEDRDFTRGRPYIYYPPRSK
jgi:hypothetical protein